MAGVERRFAPGPVREGRVGVVDIGSNSIRLVVYDAPSRALVPIYNEKAMCGLGRGLGATGRLPAEGVVHALDTLARFAALARAMGVARLDAIATAAVREAADGVEFAHEIARRTGISVEILTGAAEAKLSAQGVIADMPEADGVVGDLGGGSLELVQVSKGRIGEQTTLRLGPLRLAEDSEGDPKRALAIVEGEFARVPWLQNLKGRRFYAVGGAWRALARVHMTQTDYPLHVIDRYQVKRAKMESIVALVARMGRRSLERLPGVPKRRLEMLPMAALVMERLLRLGAPKRVIFSAHGLREGLMYGRLPAEAQKEDPLIAACRTYAMRLGRFDGMGEELALWTEVLFPKETPEWRRLRAASCWLADIGWIDHPDYRARQALDRVLHFAALAVDHPGRAFLALASFYRYGGQRGEPEAAVARALVEDEERARILGLAQRLAYALTGGAPGILRDAPLALDGDRVTLAIPPSREALAGEDANRRLQALAAAMGRKGAVARKGDKKAS